MTAAVPRLGAVLLAAALVGQELGRRRMAVSPADVDAARETLRRQLVDPADGASLVDGFPGRYVEEQARVVSGRFGTWDRTDPDAVALLPPGGRPTTTSVPTPTPAPAPAPGP